MATTYTYYQPVESTEHMLFAKEIAELVGTTPQKVAKQIEKYALVNGIEIPKLFYKTKYGLCRVYPHSIWFPATQSLQAHKN